MKNNGQRGGLEKRREGAGEGAAVPSEKRNLVHNAQPQTVPDVKGAKTRF